MTTHRGPDDLDGDLRDAVETELFRLADDEYVTGERYIEWQVVAPTIEADIAVANIAQDELGHARLWYDLLVEFGHREADLLFERDPDAFTHAALVEQPFEPGDWADYVVRSALYDEAEALVLDALAASTYAPIADRVPKVLEEEAFHRQHARNWLERLADTVDGHDRLQSAVDERFPQALTLFVPVSEGAERRIVEHGVRARSLSDLESEWRERVAEMLAEVGLSPPDVAEPPSPVGRGGEHSPAWHDLHADVTATYEELGRREPVRLRGEGR